MLLLQDGVVHAVFTRSDDLYSELAQILYRQSADGIHWSRREAVTDVGEYSLGDLAFVAGKAFVLYTRHGQFTYQTELLVQTRTP